MSSDELFRVLCARDVDRDTKACVAVLTILAGQMASEDICSIAVRRSKWTDGPTMAFENAMARVCGLNI